MLLRSCAILMISNSLVWQLFKSGHQLVKVDVILMMFCFL